ncbi:MAG: glycosyltransferase family 2 protein [Heteroscytonema crispum UTEX LB 1556]
MAPLVSIIVPCFNRANYLEKCVKSVLAQTLSDLECLIVDDGSTDNTRQVAENLMSIDSRVKYFYKENGGVSSARNLGIEKAEGDWLQCLDCDDWIHEDKTRFQLSYSAGLEDQDVIFYCDYERVYLDNQQNIVKREVNIGGSLTREQLVERLLLPDFLAKSPFPLLQQCLLIKKDIFQKNIFDNRLQALEDRHFALSLLESGVNFVYTPIIGAFYTKHQTNMTNSWDYMMQNYILFYEIENNHHEIYRKYYQPALELFLNETLRNKDKANFDKLIKITAFPVTLFDKKIKITNVNWLRLAYWFRVLTPNFVLYERYRGPRSKKLISIFSKLIKFGQTNS